MRPSRFAKFWIGMILFTLGLVTNSAQVIFSCKPSLRRLRMSSLPSCYRLLERATCHPT
jgi:hypothetical protein